MTFPWPVYQLSEVCAKISDGTHHSPKLQHALPGPGRFKYITSKNIRNSGLDLADVTYVDAAVHDEIYGRCNPELGDVLLTKDGVNTGNVAINTLDEEFSLLSSVALLKPDRSRLDPRFLKYYIESPVGFRSMIGRMTGTAIRRVILRQIKEASIPLPSLREQRRIVAEVEKHFTRLHRAEMSLRRADVNLERHRSAILNSAFMGRGLAAASSSLPTGWKWALLQDLGDVVRGASPRPAGDPRYFGGPIPWITVGVLTADEDAYLYATRETLTEEGRRRSRYIEAGTLLLTNSGATLGVPKITQIGGCINDGVAAILNVPNDLKLYLFYFLKTHTRVLRALNQGAAQPNLNTGIIKRINVPVAPIAERPRLVAEIERRLSVLEQVQRASDMSMRRATILRQSILHKAFSGQL